MNDFYMCININQDLILYAFKNTDEWEGWMSISIFSIDSYKSFTLLYLISCKFTIQTTFPTNFYTFYDGEYYTWDFRIASYGFNIRP